MRVLVTSSRNVFALDIVRKLGSLGHEVVASDTYAGAVGDHSRYLLAHVVTASPRSDTDRFIQDVSDAVRRYGIELILPTFEEAFFLSARVHDLPEGVRLFTGPFADLARLHDKASFQRLAEQAGVPIPETVVVTDRDGLQAAIARFPRWFARAAFSRGGVGLLTNTGPLQGQGDVADCVPTPDQPWLVQPFMDGPMVCTYSTVVDGRVTAQCTYRVPEQWDHSTGIAFLSVDSTTTLAHTQAIVGALDPGFTGQLSFDFVDHDGRLLAIECNPRTTNGVILLEARPFADALNGAASVVVPPGVERELRLAVVADAFAEPLQHLPVTLRDLVRVRDVDSGWHDAAAMLWSPATIVHGARLEHGVHRQLLAALADDIVWNGEPIPGMTDADAAALHRVHEQRV